LIEIYKALGGGWQIRLDDSANQAAAAITQPAERVPTPEPVP
jgi:hypothetical protein